MMIRSSNRRAFLRATGIALALPWLESLAPKEARAQSLTPKRFLAVYFPNGAAADYWTCAGQGRGDAWTLSPLLEPFAPLKAKMNVYTNLENYTAMQVDQFVEPSHARCTGAFLTCADSDAVRRELDLEVANATSLDQVIARTIGTATPALPSLQVGLSTLNSYLDGRHESLSRSISWRSPTEPLYKDVSPQRVFDRLVAAGAGTSLGGEADQAATRRRALRLSTLDFVGEQIGKTKAKLSVADRRRFDEYLTSTRELEQRIAATQTHVDRACEVGMRPDANFGVDNVPEGYDRGVHCDLMTDLVVMALRCDVTRVVSYMLDDARSDFVYRHVPQRNFSAAGSEPGNGTAGNFHAAQHAGDSNDGFATITHWLAGKACALALKLDAIDDGNGTLLDNSVLLYGSDMHGSNHDANELPIVTLGSAGGVFRTNQHLVFEPTPNDRPLRDLYRTILTHGFGITEPFGNSVKGVQERPITELLG
jgi:hypothetical protein